MLNHSNIVLVLDVGRAGNDHFIVMEYVDGVDMKQVSEAYVNRGAMPPLEFTLLMAVEICRALSYAHNLSDARGRPLNIVHHDINPANVLLSLQGEIKVVDFGLSTAAMHLQKSDPDVVRGKFGYLSPRWPWAGEGTRAPTSTPSGSSSGRWSPASGSSRARTTWTGCAWRALPRCGGRAT